MEHMQMLDDPYKTDEEEVVQKVGVGPVILENSRNLQGGLAPQNTNESNNAVVTNNNQEQR